MNLLSHIPTHTHSNMHTSTHTHTHSLTHTHKCSHPQDPHFQNLIWRNKSSKPCFPISDNPKFQVLKNLCRRRPKLSTSSSVTSTHWLQLHRNFWAAPKFFDEFFGFEELSTVVEMDPKLGLPSPPLKLLVEALAGTEVYLAGRLLGSQLTSN